MGNTCQKNRLQSYLPASLAEVDQLFDQVFGQSQARRGGWRTPVAVWEAEDRLHVEMDVPGASLDATEVTFDKGVLTVTVERKPSDEQRQYWHNERAFGKSSRSVTLPESVDPDTISAELNQGVLHISIAKKPEAQPRRIEVKGA